MGNMILCAGPCGSGKSTFCREFIKKHPNYIHLNVDKFYQTYNGEQKHENEFEVWIMFFNAIHSAAIVGKNVIIDTNALDAFDREQFIRWFPEFEYHYLYWVFTTHENAYNNNLQRSRVIPQDQWDKMWNKAEIPDDVADRDWDAIRYIYNCNNKYFKIYQDFSICATIVGVDEITEGERK